MPEISKLGPLFERFPGSCSEPGLWDITKRIYLISKKISNIKNWNTGEHWSIGRPLAGGSAKESVVCWCHLKKGTKVFWKTDRFLCWYQCINYKSVRLILQVWLRDIHEGMKLKGLQRNAKDIPCGPVSTHYLQLSGRRTSGFLFPNLIVHRSIKEYFSAKQKQVPTFFFLGVFFPWTYVYYCMLLYTIIIYHILDK